MLRLMGPFILSSLKSFAKQHAFSLNLLNLPHSTQLR